MSRTARNLIFALVVLGVLAALDFVFKGNMISPYIVRIMMLSGIAITLAVSLNLINGFTGQFSIGHAGFMAVGAYSSAYFSVNYGAGLTAGLGGGILGWVVSLGLATLVGALAAAVAGLLVGVPSLRLKGDYLAIVTLGFGQIIVVLINNIEAVGGARGYSGIPIVKSFFWIFLIAVLTIVIVYNIVNSAFGRALISIREDELAAEAMGVNTTRYKVLAFVISSAMAGAGGVLLAHFDGYLNPKSFEFIRSFEILIMIILGGLGSIVGSILGAILLTVLPEALRGFAEYRMVIYSLLLIILMITRPQGLLGNTDPFKGWRARQRNKTRTEAEEITAEDTRDINASVDKATLGERQKETSLGEGDASK
ncbi:MAG TPA: branched-chain amino acid ABC transporter permease [Pyrinomonadaceae bacterium]|jgi:branched-chain amino acid transport system permease protein|nr:branched-chain amino acid ABC transporter permease [Pyrinomonadaceae bacterium]